MFNPDAEIKMKRAAEVPIGSIHSDTEAVSNDLSILRKPIKTSVNGLNEAKKAYEDGTDEVCEKKNPLTLHFKFSPFANKLMIIL